MPYHYRITTDGTAFTTREPIREADFRAAAGARPADRIADVTALIQGRADFGHVERVASAEAAAGFPPGVSVWRISTETGRVEGWRVGG
jgi:hypothetical protein